MSVYSEMTHEDHVANCARLRAELRVLQEEERNLRLHVFAENSSRDGFYDSQEWKELRYEVLKERGRRCECCGAGKDDGATVQVDHVKPRSKYPELALEKTNLQVLCEPCNLGKSNTDETDWRNR